MKILMLTTSPRKAFSTSCYFAGMLKLALAGHEVACLPLKTESDYNAVLAGLDGLDALVFATPVYVDTLPSTTLEYLERLEGHIRGRNCRFKVYALTNCGLYEGHQCALALETYRLWCSRAGLDWQGGLGVGGGVMIGFVRVLPFVGLAITAARLLLMALTGGAWFFPINLIIETTLWLLFTLGTLVGIFRLSRAIRAGGSHGARYTTVWFCPRFLFVGVASLYWVVRALVQYGVPPWRLFEKQQICAKKVQE